MYNHHSVYISKEKKLTFKILEKKLKPIGNLVKCQESESENTQTYNFTASPDLFGSISFSKEAAIVTATSKPGKITSNFPLSALKNLNLISHDKPNDGQAVSFTKDETNTLRKALLPTYNKIKSTEKISHYIK